MNKGRTIKESVSSGMKMFAILAGKELDLLSFYLRTMETGRG